MKYLSILLICLPWSPSNVANWGANGHRIVAKICYDNLTEKAKKAVDEELGDNYLAQVANWPDYIRSEKGWEFAEPWHYTTIAPDQTLAQSVEEYANDPKVNDVIEGIELMEAILKDDPKATQTLQSLMDKSKVKPLAGSMKATAIAFLLHFIGDIHQPMHVGKNRDLGGNKIEVLFFSERMNIHRVWDTEIIEQERLSFTEFSSFIVKHTHAKKAAWEKASVIEWAEESIIEREKIYNTLYNYTDRDSGLPSFSYQYQHDFLPVVEERLAAAGYRAAAMLNAIYK